MRKFFEKYYFVFLLIILLGGFFVRFYRFDNPSIVVAGKAVQRLTPKNALVIAS